MMKRLVAGLTAGLLMCGGVAWAENEATFDFGTGVLNIPKVGVGGVYYNVNMQQQGQGLNFAVTGASPTTASGTGSIVGAWSAAQSTGSHDGIPHTNDNLIIFLSNGNFVHYSYTIPAQSCCDGVERGTYLYDPSTGNTSLTITFDGVPNGPDEGIGILDGTYTMTTNISGDSMTIFDRNETLTFSRVR